jgi:hypothetical protein
MKLDLEDGRMLSLPDEVSDEFARALKTLILSCEKRARDAEQRAGELAAEVAHLRAEIQALAERPLPALQVITDNGAVLEALGRVERAVLADRVMLNDEYGNPKSRAVPR